VPKKGLLPTSENASNYGRFLVLKWVGKNDRLWHTFCMAPRRTSLNAVLVKTALYARVSTDDGRQTVANQVRQLRELAVAREFEIFREYTDEETGEQLLFQAYGVTGTEGTRLRMNPLGLLVKAKTNQRVTPEMVKELSEDDLD
jgi:hypothetical protein